jgi:asparagine synthase (glutamine-hydrolysing)
MVRIDRGPVDITRLRQMTDRQRHRGPDDEGYLLGNFPDGVATPAGGAETVPSLRAHLRPVDEVSATQTFSLGFGHRRLSIVDCTPAGHQPMADATGTLWLIYNGEIYNYIELRAELEAKGHVFRTRSDTEVILAAYSEWGRACLERFNGMWALALWDRRRGELFCARDRFGIKPFYYRFDGSTFTFASEIKALLAASPEPPAVNGPLAYDYLVFDFLDHTAGTLFAGILQLPPSHCLVLDGHGRLTIERYYTLHYATAAAPCDETRIVELGSAYRELLSDAVRLRLRTDVPLGSCLSGGLDSSSIVCALSQLLSTPNGAGPAQRTFTAAYDDPVCDERRFANQVVEATGVQATYTFPQAADLWNEIQALTWHQDEPFGSTSIYAQWCVMRAARRGGVTVMLDGQGGDELFAGYLTYYPILLKNLLRHGHLADFQRELHACAARMGQSPWRLAAKAAAVLYEPLRRLFPASPRGAELLNDDFARPHRRRRTHWRELRSTNNLQARLWADQVQFSIPQLLRYEDRNSMAFSVEARLPFLDYRLVEWAFAQPVAVKLHGGWTKYVARRGVTGLCPEGIAWRTDKVGFATPEARWMDAGADIIQALAAPATFRAAQFIDPVKFRDELAATPRRWSRELWRVANFELWMRVFGIAGAHA